MRSGDVQRALPLLEALYTDAPQNTAFYRTLKDAYESVKRYDEALQLVDARLGDAPTVPLLTEKARLQYQKDAVQAANATWDRALRLAPNTPQTYRTIYQTLVDLRHFQKAIAVLKNGRSTLDQPGAFRPELAYLYGLDGQFRTSMREYVALLAEAPERVGYVKDRLRTFVEQGQGLAASIVVLEAAVEDAPLRQAYRELLAWLHMERNDYAAALDVYRALDRLKQQQGRLLYRFAQKAADAQRFGVATRACTAVLDRHPNADVAPDARLTLGSLYRQWASLKTDTTSAAQDSARYDRARSAYTTFLRSHPDHPDRPTGLLKLGTLQLDVYHAPKEAAATFEELVSNHPQTIAAAQGQYHQARVALFQDHLSRARLLFSRLAERANDGDLADRARYELGLLHFYQGEFDAATARADAISQDPAADVANDAIELKTLLQENRGPDSLDAALQIYAQARLHQRQRAYPRALTQLDSLVQAHPRHPLADNARFQRGTVHLARRDTAAALSAFRAVPERHPRSPYADRSLFRAGELLESSERPAAAASTYSRLLTEYPTSLLVGKARGRLRALPAPQG
jgi:TolA-binding protein